MFRGRINGFMLACISVPICLAFQFKADPNFKLGQKMANLITDADHHIKTDSKTGIGGLFQQALADELNSDEEGLVNPNVSEVIAQANSLAEHETLARDELCSRSWALPCPDGWSRISDLTCAAPASYEGPCKQLQNLTPRAIVEKNKFARSCNAPWPCEDVCKEGHEYEGCPEGWTDMGDGFCNIQSTTNPKCMTAYKFNDMSIADKQALAIACGQEWKCKATCKHDYSKSCPEKWTELLGACTAPAAYAGDCAYSINTTAMTAEQKHSLAEKCLFDFPCVGPYESSQQIPNTKFSSGVLLDGPVDPSTGSVVIQNMDSRMNKQTESWLQKRFDVPSGPIMESRI